jgi:hypothetical protein
MNDSKRPWRMRVLLIALAVVAIFALGAIAQDGDTGPARTATERRVSTAPDAPAQTIDEARRQSARARSRSQR